MNIKLIRLWIIFGFILLSCEPSDKFPVTNIQSEFQTQDGQVFELSGNINRASKLALIKKAGEKYGLTNPILMAGIAQQETGLAHCHSEATWACQGPSSPDCGGGAVIAGSGDGPCSAKQGGLCMFQFDSGVHTQTLSTYGSRILNVQGCTESAVEFVLERAIQNVSGLGFSNKNQVIQWMNSINVSASDEQFNRWISFISHRYNGCKGCTSVENKYRISTINLINEMNSIVDIPPPSPTPPDPVVAQPDFGDENEVIQNPDACEYVTPNRSTVLKGQALKIYADASSQSESIDFLYFEELIKIVRTVKADDGRAWYEVRLSGNSKGFIFKELLQCVSI